MRLAPFEFLAQLGLVGQRQQRRHADPAQPGLLLLPDIRHPAVIGARQGEIDIVLPGQRAQEKGRKNGGDVDADLVHVVEP